MMTTIPRVLLAVPNPRRAERCLGPALDGDLKVPRVTNEHEHPGLGDEHRVKEHGAD